MDSDEIQGENKRELSKTHVGALILKLNAMAKKPHLDDDISGVLDKYLQKLNESEKYLSNGIFNTNFAEAALLLQSSVNVYGKKVDMLWDVVNEYQHRIVSYEEDSEAKQKELEAVKERQTKFKRKRKVQETPENKEPEPEKPTTSDANTEPLITDIKVEKDTEEAGESVPMNSQEQISAPNNNNNNNNVDDFMLSDQFPFLIDTPMYEENVMNFGAMNSNKLMYYLNYYYPSFYEKASKAGSSRTPITCYEQDLLLQRFLFKKQCTLIDMMKLHVEEFENYLASYCRAKEAAVEKIPPALREKCAALCPKLLVTQVMRLSQDVVNQYMHKDFQEEEPTKEQTLAQLCSTLCPKMLVANVKRLSEEVVEQYMHKQAKEEQMSDDENASEKGDDDNTSESTEHDSAFGDDTSLDATKNDSLNESNANTDDSVLQTQEKSVEQKKRRKSFDPDEEKIPKKKRKSTVLVKPIIKATAPLIEFEKFMREHYQIMDGEEGCITPLEAEDTHESTADDTGIGTEYSEAADTNNETFGTATDTPTAANDSAETMQECTESDNETLHNNSEEQTSQESSTEQTSQNPTEPATFGEAMRATLEEIQKSERNVREWTAFIQEKLKNQPKSCDFDIHQYGSKIIDSIPPDKNKKFREIVSGKSAGEVSRYLLATLQLANTYNVELTNTCEGRLASDLELKLLSKDMYHESLTSYMAPSEETFRERLARVQSLNPKIPLCSTPMTTEKQQKKRKVVHDNLCSYPSTSKRCLFESGRTS